MHDADGFLCALSGVPRLWACGVSDEVKPARERRCGCWLTGQCDVKPSRSGGLSVSSTQRCDECCKDPPSPGPPPFENVRYATPKQFDGRD